ncbi:hypothetical protein IAT38_000290 [Cryptococcus sp. DSM 104549]
MISPSAPVRAVALGKWLEQKVARGEADLQPAFEPAPVLASAPATPSSPASTNGSLPSSTRSLFFGRTLPDPRGLPIKEHGASDPALNRSPSPTTSAASPSTPKAKSGVRFILPPPKGAHRAESAEHEGMALDEPTPSVRALPSTPSATPPTKTKAVAIRQHNTRSTVAVSSPLHRVHAHRRSYSANRPPPLALRASRTVLLDRSPTTRWARSPTRASHHRAQPTPLRTCAPVPRAPLPLAPIVQEQQLRELNLEQLRIGQWIVPPPPTGYDYEHRPGCTGQGCTHATAAAGAPHTHAAQDAPNTNGSKELVVAGQSIAPYKPVRNSGAWITPWMARHMFFGGVVTATLPDGSPLVLSMSKEQRDLGLPVAAIAGVPTRSVLGRAMWAEWMQAAKEGRRLQHFKMTKLRREMEVTMRRGLKLKALPDPSAVAAHQPSPAPQRSSPPPPATPMVKVEPDL